MLTLIIIILGASFVLYTLLGGADYGAGILEIFAGEKEEKTISKALAPVWEANHVWLILAVVILFTGFPSVYSSLSIALHIPLLIVLLGIIFRGTAFTFRHYDIHPDRAHKYYAFLFKAASLLTPIFLGITLGAMILGRISFDQTAGFYKIYIWPWANWFCLSMGIFSTSLFVYIASVFLIGEAKDESERQHYSRMGKRSMLLTVFTGLLVFVLAETEGLDLLQDFLKSPVSIVMLTLASLLCPAIWVLLNKEKNKTLWLRLSIGLQVTAIIIGWFYIQYPVMIEVQGAEALTFYNTQAPQATLKQLLIALMVGLVLVVPAFVYLFRVFKVKQPEAGEQH
jgi:cytochrome d ubiquinol oxidase subunit II